jgi:hypothetical protein
MQNFVSEIAELGTEVFVVAIKHRDGRWLYFRGSNFGEGTSEQPYSAAQFPLNHSPVDLFTWIDEQIKRLKTSSSPLLFDTVTLVRYRSQLEVEDLDTHDWRIQLQRHAVSKLTRMEIEALNLQSVEMERKLAQAPAEPDPIDDVPF